MFFNGMKTAKTISECSYKRTNKIFLIFNSLNTNTSYLNDFSTTVKSHNLCYITYDIQTGIQNFLQLRLQDSTAHLHGFSNLYKNLIIK